MCQVFAIMSGQAQFNSALMIFIGFVPDPSQKKLEDQTPISPKFFDILRYQINPNLCQASIRNHAIRLDENQKPKSFYFVEVDFKLLKIANSQNQSDQDQNDKVVLEKVYGDFKRLHAHILETFQNELKEFERIQQIIERDDGKLENYQISGNPT